MSNDNYKRALRYGDVGSGFFDLRTRGRYGTSAREAETSRTRRDRPGSGRLEGSSETIDGNDALHSVDVTRHAIRDVLDNPGSVLEGLS